MQKLLSFFSTKNFCVFGYKVVKHLSQLTSYRACYANDALNNPRPYISITLLGCAAQLAAWLNQEFNTRSSHILYILLPLIQEGQLSVAGKSMCTKYWLNTLPRRSMVRLTDCPDMTTAVNNNTTNQIIMHFSVVPIPLFCVNLFFYTF